MRVTSVAVLAAGLLGALFGCGKGSPTSAPPPGTPAPSQPAGPSASGAPSLDGTYLLVEGEVFGKKQTAEEIAKGPEDERTFVIKGNTMSDLFGRKGKSQSIKLNADKTPHEIDMFDPKEGEKESAYGIYKLEGDKLTIAMGGKKPEERPRNFNFGEKNVALVLVMVKKK